MAAADRWAPPSETLIVDGAREGESYAVLLYRSRRDGLVHVCSTCASAADGFCGGCRQFWCWSHSTGGDDRRHGQPEGCIG